MSWFLLVSGRAELEVGIKSTAADHVVTSGFLQPRMVLLSPRSITGM